MDVDVDRRKTGLFAEVERREGAETIMRLTGPADGDRRVLQGQLYSWQERGLHSVTHACSHSFVLRLSFVPLSFVFAGVISPVYNKSERVNIDAFGSPDERPS